MSNPQKDHSSTGVNAPSGGHNTFTTSEFEQSAANKKKHMGSDIFGSNQNYAEPAPVKHNRNTGNNIFGTDSEQSNASAGTLAGQYKQTQMKSNIFGTDEPTSARQVSDKNKSNIFGVGDSDEQKRQAGGGRHGLRDPNASRMGYNPISGESYTAKNNVNDKQPDSTVKKPGEENGNGQTVPPTNSADNANGQSVPPTNPVENANGQTAPPTNPAENGNARKPVDATNGNDAQKNVHTSVRVFHPPGGKSNGPLW